jgi:hypothetical protein
MSAVEPCQGDFGEIEVSKLAERTLALLEGSPA